MKTSKNQKYNSPFLVIRRHTSLESEGGRALVLTPASFRNVENQSVMKINLSD